MHGGTPLIQKVWDQRVFVVEFPVKLYCCMYSGMEYCNAYYSALWCVLIRNIRPPVLAGAGEVYCDELDTSLKFGINSISTQSGPADFPPPLLS